ncbi:hypothetical protein EDC01DRAFT_732738 [Geopyxis carbonaria]|nr:hypothetical protein EDC01DRAFT_732738 [Geopyxis carbonaria]
MTGHASTPPFLAAQLAPLHTFGAATTPPSATVTTSATPPAPAMCTKSPEPDVPLQTVFVVAQGIGEVGMEVTTMPVPQLLLEGREATEGERRAEEHGRGGEVMMVVLGVVGVGVGVGVGVVVAGVGW